MSDGGCVSTGPCLDFELIGVSEIVADGIEVYPNPAYGACYIRSLGSAIRSVKLLDMAGKTVHHSGCLPNGEEYYQLSLLEIPAGMYTLVVSLDDETCLVRRIVAL